MTTTRTRTATFHNRLLTLIFVHPGLQPSGLAACMGRQDRERIGSMSRALESAHAGKFIAYWGDPAADRYKVDTHALHGWRLTEHGKARLKLYGSD